DRLPPEDGVPESAGAGWSWGAFTVEHIADIAVDLFRRALIASPLLDRGNALLRERLKQHYATANELRTGVPRTRRSDQRFWGECGAALATRLAEPSRTLSEDVRHWAADCMQRWSARTWRLDVPEGVLAVGPAPFPAGDAPIQQALGWVAAAF